MFPEVNQKLKALVGFGQVVTSGIRLREDEILELIYNQASKLMDTNNMYIALYDEPTDTVRFGLVMVDGKRIDVEKEEGYQPRRGGKGKTETIIRTRKPIFHATRAEAEAWYAQPGHEEYVGAALPSWVGVPMMVGEKVLGVISTYHPTRDYVYSGDDLEILQAMANQAAIALDNAHMFYDVSRRLEALVDFGQAVTSGIRLREDEVLELVYSQASKLMDTDNIYIALYDEATDTVRFGLAFVDGRCIDVEKEEGWQPRKAGKGRTEEIIRTRKPIFTATKAETEAWYAQPEHEEYVGRTFASWLGVPMMVGEKVLGVIATYHPTWDYIYSGDDLEILQAMADQAAIALNEAKVYMAWQQEQERRVAEEKYAYLGHAADGIAHRINNTIALLPLCASDIRRHLKTVDSFVDEQLDMIERNARYVLELAEELQKPSRPSEAGRFDINRLLEDAIRAASVPLDVDVVTVFDSSLPKVQTPRLLVDVFVELITNAVDAMSEPRVKRLEIGSQASDTEFVEVWFTDTGRGIPKEKQDRLFDLFYTTAEKEKPTAGVSKGFGLWWIRTFLAWQGGEIAVESELGEGATFRVRLPSEAPL